MKTLTYIFALITATVLANTASAGNIYNITKNETVSSADIPAQCPHCTINIADGATLVINKDIYLQNTSFNGGTVSAVRSITFWSPGEFNNTTVNVGNGSAIISSGKLEIVNSVFNFYGSSSATFWAPVTMDDSKMNFLDNSSVEITASFTLDNQSSMVAGDGTMNSSAFIKFNGGKLVANDNSYVSLSSYNNYYYNWSSYKGDGKNIATTNNNLNCGGGNNSCQSQVLYGPSSLTTKGVVGSAILPVKLSAFNVKLSGIEASIAWTTDMEAKSSHFEIERSVDGISWSKVGSVQAKGNSSVVNRYAYTDILKISGNVSYRLKMVDIDGTSAFSPIRTVKVAGTVKMSIFPNPATNYVIITSKDNASKNVQLINQYGQVVKQATGAGNINLAVSEFNTGNYYVRVSDAAGAAETFKLVINR